MLHASRQRSHRKLAAKQPVHAAEDERWQNEAVVGEKREPMHAPLRAFESATHAHAAQVLCDPATTDGGRWVKLLTPARWAFNLAPSPDAAPLVRLGTGFDTSGWGDVAVPLSLEAGGFGQTQYTNVRYPFPLEPPKIPSDANHVGSYQTTFDLPKEWRERRVFLQFDGVGSAATVWLDGQEVGYSQDWALPAEFELTALLGGAEEGGGDEGGRYVLSVQVLRFCDGSYLEGQDQWWFSGIHRHVRLYSKPAPLAICDFAVSTTVAEDGASAEVSVQVRLDGAAVAEAAGGAASLAGYQLSASLHGPYLLALGGGAPQAPEVWRAEANVTLAPDAAADGGGGAAAEGEAGGLLSGGGAAVAVGRLDAPQLWSAEAPALYTLLLELSTGGGADGAPRATCDVEACRVGVRSVAVAGGLLRLNGAPLCVRGVCRHEHSATGGKAVSWEEQVGDATALKRHNFNAVRTAHYPNGGAWYELCDALGLYVVDEANIETHGFFYAPYGNEGTLARRPSWRHAFMARLCRMVRRDKNHACVVTWSLGNEAGYGPTHEAMADWCRAHDPSRPVQYESCGGAPCTDILCPMYPPLADVPKLATDVGAQCAPSSAFAVAPTRSWPRHTHTGELRPLILSEYCHAMGNSTGNLQEWWEAFAAHPHAQGGFIWDWIDQGLAASSARGARFYKYGGDYGEAVHDAQFCVNGLNFPDRTPHPAMEEVKRVHRPVAAAFVSWADDAADGAAVRAAVRVTNRHDFAGLAHLSLAAALEADGAPLAAMAPVALAAAARAGGPLAELARLRPGQSLAVELELQLDAAAAAAAAAAAPRELWLRVRFSLAAGAAWADAGHEVACEQWPVPPPAALPPPAAAPPPPAAPAEGELAVDEAEDVFVLRGAGAGGGGGAPFALRVCRRSGSLALLAGEARVVEEGGWLQLWRAPTDNDHANTLSSITRPTAESIRNMPWYMRLFFALPDALNGCCDPEYDSYDDLWRRAGLHAAAPRLRRLRLARRGAGCAELSFEYALHAPARGAAALAGLRDGALLATHALCLRVFADGELLLLSEAAALARVPTLPRVGLLLALPPACAACRWLGRGPHENYADRCESAAVGVHEAAVDELFTPYLVPGECGHREAARWLELRAPSGGAGLRVASVGQPFGWNALRYSAAQLDGAAHPHELTPDPARLWLSLDHRMLGVGGDTGWTKSVMPRYRVPPGTYRWAVALRPFADDAQAAACRAAPDERARREAAAWLAARGPAFEPVGRWRALLWRLRAAAVLVLAALLALFFLARLAAECGVAAYRKRAQQQRASSTRGRNLHSELSDVPLVSVAGLDGEGGAGEAV